MPSTEITVNGTRHVVEADGDVPLLWVLRDLLGLTGTKYGCGEGSCGACTVLEGDEPVRSCLVTLADAAGLSYTTIEGLAARGGDICQRAWLEENVAQCGYCQGGVLLKVWSLLGRHRDPTDEEIDAALSDHICRCGTYPRMRRAIHRAAASGGAR
jgi:aerobic-type carbon monoxide dehydrogenase small subunit (CoxS/CutS family)